MSDIVHQMPIYRVGDLSPRKPVRFDLAPSEPVLEAIARDLGLIDLRKVRFRGTFVADGRNDWRFDGHLGATVVQPCSITLAPVTTRLEEDVTRRFLKDWPLAQEDGEEVEMPEDETIDPLGDQIDLRVLATEALALALPPYPRAPGAELGNATFAAPGVAPLQDKDTKPFAGLADLKKTLENKS